MRGVLAVAVDGAEAEQDCGDDDGNGAEHNLGDVFGAGAFKLAEEQAAPENADKGVGVPEGEGDGEADVANGEYGERVGDGPEHAGEHGVENQMLVLGEVGEDVARAFEQGGQRPARGEYAGHHAERDGKGREAGVDQLGGGFRRAEPHPGSKGAGYADAVDDSSPDLRSSLPWCSNACSSVVARLVRSVQRDEKRQANAEYDDGHEEVAVGKNGMSF